MCESTCKRRLFMKYFFTLLACFLCYSSVQAQTFPNPNFPNVMRCLTADQYRSYCPSERLRTRIFEQSCPGFSNIVPPPPVSSPPTTPLIPYPHPVLQPRTQTCTAIEGYAQCPTLQVSPSRTVSIVCVDTGRVRLVSLNCTPCR